VWQRNDWNFALIEPLPDALLDLFDLGVSGQSLPSEISRFAQPAKSRFLR
jgi:hypothetical protein